MKCSFDYERRDNNDDDDNNNNNNNNNNNDSNNNNNNNNKCNLTELKTKSIRVLQQSAVFTYGMTQNSTFSSFEAFLPVL